MKNLTYLQFLTCLIAALPFSLKSQKSEWRLAAGLGRTWLPEQSDFSSSKKYVGQFFQLDWLRFLNREAFVSIGGGLHHRRFYHNPLAGCHGCGNIPELDHQLTSLQLSPRIGLRLFKRLDLQAGWLGEVKTGGLAEFPKLSSGYFFGGRVLIFKKIGLDVGNFRIPAPRNCSDWWYAARVWQAGLSFALSQKD